MLPVSDDEQQRKQMLEVPVESAVLAEFAYQLFLAVFSRPRFSEWQGENSVLVNSGSWINELRAIGKTTFARLFIGIDRGEIVSRSGHGDGDRYRAKTLQLLSSIRRSSATNYFSGSGFLLMTS